MAKDGSGRHRAAASRYLLALALLAAALPALPVRADSYLELRHRFLPGIKGEDQRHILDSDAAPWRAIGRVNRRTGGYCTGTLIAPGIVLTAAHCLWNRRTGRWLGPEALHFVGGYRRGSWVADAPVKALRLSPQAAASGSNRGSNGGSNGGGRIAPAGDWAVLTLATPLTTLGFIPTGPLPAPAQPLTQVGYSQDKPHILTAHEGCHVLSSDAGLVLHDCDATHGDSGSPLLILTAEGPRLAAMHVATGQGATGPVGIAVPAASVQP